MGAAKRALIAGLLIVAGCGGETPPQLVRGQVEESARALVSSVTAMGLDGLRGRSQLDEGGGFLIALPVDEADSYQLQLQSADGSMIVPFAGQNGRLKVCEAEKEIDLGHLRLIRGCEGTCIELEISVADCQQRNQPECERTQLEYQFCAERAAESCMLNVPNMGICEMELCAGEEQLMISACIDACAPFNDGLQRCLAAAAQSCVFPVVALSDLGLPSVIGCALADGAVRM